MKRSILVLMSFLVFAGTALAQVPEGYFAGKFTASGRSVRVFTRTVVTKVRLMDPKTNKVTLQSIATNYGLIIRPYDNTAALFRIEELDDGTQSWVELFQSRDYLPTVDINQQPTYAGQVLGNNLLRLTPNKFGRDLGCDDIIEARRSKAVSWESLPKDYLSVRGKHSKLEVWSGAASGTFVVNGYTYSGDYSLEPLFAGVGLLRGQTLDAESTNGKAVDKEITAFVVATKHRKSKYVFWDDTYRELRIIRMQPGSETCLFPSVNLNND